MSGIVPSGILETLVGATAAGGALQSREMWAGASASVIGAKGKVKNPVQDAVRKDVVKRIEALAAGGSIFEENAKYEDSPKDTEDALLIVQGIDPASIEAAKNGERFMVRREIPIERRHWVACMRGIITTPSGCAFVHSDGSITMLKNGIETKCKCGAIHCGI